MALRRQLLGLLPLLGLCAGTDAFATDVPVDDSNPRQIAAAEPKTLQTIVVTGTHIRSIDLQTQHPLLVLKREDLLATGLTDIAQIAQHIVSNGQTQNRNINNGNDGRELVNLRSLGANRTLVLENGQRWVSALDGAVDLSAIPMALVESIEVLKDGASAIYGSDAIAGVVNIITRKDFHGAELGTYAGETDHGDGLRRDLDFSYGGSGDRWNASFGVEYAKDDPVMARDRAISSVPIAGLPLGATGATYLMFRYDNGPFTLASGRPGTAPGDFRPFDFASDWGVNYAAWNYLETPLERKAIFAQGRYDVTPALSFATDALFNRRRSAQQLAPPRVNFGAFCCAGASNGFNLSQDSVYNPLGETIKAFQRRFLEDGPRRFEQSVDTTRVHLGIEGMFDVAGRAVAWGADATHTRAVQRETIGPYQDNARLQLAVGPSFFDPDGIARCGTPASPIEGCVPIDLLGAPGSITPAMLDYVDVHASNRLGSEGRDYNLHATSRLFDLPAGAVNAAAGLEYRRESGRDDPDELLASGRANGGGINYRPTSGSYSVKEAFAEVEIPLVAGHPFVRQLDLDVATRWSDYSRFGGTANSQWALRWKPADDLLFRASYIQGFRAPSVLDLFQGLIATGEGTADPCASRSHPSASTLARCAALGVPANVPDYGGTDVTLGGNPALRPEVSRTRTLGLVFDPSWLPDLSATLDWYRIEVVDAIGERSAQAMLNACYILGDPNACAQITRSPDDGSVFRVNATQQNIPGGLESEGYDFTLAWQRTTRWGRFDVRWDNAYVDYHGNIGRPAAGTLLPGGSLASGNMAGHDDPDSFFGVVWRLRSALNIGWQRGNWNASIGARYFSPIVESCAMVRDTAEVTGDASLLNLCSDPGHIERGSSMPRNRVGAVTYFDVQMGWVAPWQGRFAVGVRNVFDREPPVSYSAYANSFFSDYDIPGRFFYASYRQKF